jgi:signal transduction histidine kinase
MTTDDSTMSVTILTMSIGSEDDLLELRQRTRQIAGLLGFPTRQQAEIAAGAAGAGATILNSVSPVDVQFLVEESSPAQLFQVMLSFDSALAGTDAFPFARELLDDIGMTSEPESTRVLLSKQFPPGTPRVAGEALSKIAGELARRSRPESVFLEIQEQNRELFGAMRELARLNRELDGYAHVVSHDLKGPLTDIMLANELLREKLESGGMSGGDRGVQMLVDTIKNNVRRSAALIDDLLALAEAGQASTVESELDLNEVIARVLAERALVIRDRDVEVLLDDDLGTIRASAIHMHQLFANLVDNAITHNDASRPVIEIRRLTDEPGGWAKFLLRDNGAGIPTEELEKVFVPFHEGDKGSTGVELAIADKIVKLYNGEISAYNNDGACFEFVIQGLVG